MSRPGVLVIGDVIADRLIVGEMTRISPEAPAPVVRQRQQTLCGGGAANVAANLAGLGQTTWLFGIVGTPEHDVMSQWLTDRGVICKLLTPTGAKTVTKTRIVCSDRQVLRLDDENDYVAHPDIVHSGVTTSLGWLLDNEPRIRMLVVADYDKGTMPDETARWLVAECARRGLSLFVDTKPHRFELYRGATLLKPNMAEAMRALDDGGCVHPALATDDEDSIADVALRFLVDRFGFPGTVLTRGSRGALAHFHGIGTFSVPVTPQKAGDVTGAGDTFMAALVASFLEGRLPREAVVRAVAAGALAVCESGTAVITTEKLEAALTKTAGPAGKITTAAMVAPVTERKRREGKQIVFTNGCFDLLHPGHLSVLRFAKQQGDVLVVACNDDDSVATNKGAGRPLIRLADRLEMLSLMPEVDYVVPFDGDVEAVVRQVKPDVLVKGAEYRDTAIPGAEFVAAHGGRIELAPMANSPHTSDVVRALGTT